MTLSDSARSVDLVQEKEGTDVCRVLLEKSAEAKGNAEKSDVNTQGETLAKANEWSSVTKDMDLPVEILPNLYSLSVSNTSIKHRSVYKNGKLNSESVRLKCRVNYRLNGRKEGKRYLIFTSYDDRDRIIDIQGEHIKYHFTDAGFEFVDVYFADYDKAPIRKIGISVREIHSYHE